MKVLRPRDLTLIASGHHTELCARTANIGGNERCYRDEEWQDRGKETRKLNLECDSGLDLLPEGKNALKDIIGIMNEIGISIAD